MGENRRIVRLLLSFFLSKRNIDAKNLITYSICCRISVGVIFFLLFEVPRREYCNNGVAILNPFRSTQLQWMQGRFAETSLLCFASRSSRPQLYITSVASTSVVSRL
jgi:hypothetical protein